MSQWARAEYRLTQDQFDWIRELSYKVAMAEGTKPDASVIIRKIIDHYKEQSEAPAKTSKSRSRNSKKAD